MNGIACGGIVVDSFTTLYDSTAACCAAEFQWMDGELCSGRSSGLLSYKYWPDYVNSKCSNDLGNLSDLSVPMFDTVEACCSSKISWMAVEKCIAISTGN